MRRPIIAGNWKMNMIRAEGMNLIRALKQGLDDSVAPEVVVAPPFTLIDGLRPLVTGTGITLAAQNVHWADSGAYTGEISARMLKDLECRYVIVGHSERRHLFGDSDEDINKRVRAVLDAGMAPILCIGETLEQREKDLTWELLTQQVIRGLRDVSEPLVTKVVLAYEPVWAIGTGRTASEAQVAEAHGFLRNLLRESFPAHVANAVRILYGGSVKPTNIDALMAQDNVDGALVGGASLKADSFLRIIAYQAPRR